MKKIVGLFIICTFLFLSTVTVMATTANQSTISYEVNATDDESANNQPTREEKKAQWQEQAQKQIDKEKQLQERLKEKVKDEEKLRLQAMKKSALSLQKMWLQTEKLEKISERLSRIMEQYQADQNVIEKHWEKIQNRGSFVRFLIGPNYYSIDLANQAIDQQKTRLEELTKLASEIDSPTDIKAYQTTLDEFQQSLDTVRADLQAEESKFGLFGWLSKKYAKYLESRPKTCAGDVPC